MAAGYGLRGRLREAAIVLACLFFVAPAAAGPPRLLVLGDSLTAGYGLAQDDAFQARLAAALSAFQMGIFTLFVWVPIMAGGSANAFQWSETVISWALTAAGWLVADSYRDLSLEQIR